MNWGKGIAIALGLFIVFIGFLAFTLIRQNVDLVTDDYYKQDMAYQKEIDAIEAGNALEKMVVGQKNGQLVFEFDENDASDSIVINLWRPNDKSLDKTYSVKGTRLFMIPVYDLQVGFYDIKCDYWTNGTKSVQKTKILIEGDGI